MKPENEPHASISGWKWLKIIPVVAIVFPLLSCGDGGSITIFYPSWGINSAYTGYSIVMLTSTDTGDLCHPDEIPSDPRRIEFGDVSLDWNCDLFFDSLGLPNEQDC